MKHTHPHIAGRTFSTPQGSDACFQHFIESFDGSPEELLEELSSEIAARHGRAIPIATASPQEQPFLLEISRFIVVYTLCPGTVEVSTVLAKQDPAHPDDRHYFTATTTLPEEQCDLHPDIAAKNIDYVNLDTAFDTFVFRNCGGQSADQLLHELEHTLRTQHGQAQPARVCYQHPRTIWELSTPSLRFQYQILPDRVEVGGIWSIATGQVYEPKHDLLAEYTK